jgi:TolA-binding protein
MKRRGHPSPDANRRLISEPRAPARGPKTRRSRSGLGLMIADRAHLFRIVAGFALVLAVPAPTARAGGPEDRRLDAGQFRKGLKDRGLTDLLELYLNEVPPADPVEALLLERDIRLAQHTDPARSTTERRHALLEADRLLERLIAEHPDDLRAFDWRLELGRSLLQREAEPYYSSILYRGGTAAERRSLAEVMERAQELFGRLRVELARELDRLDRIAAPTYERLELSGYIERIEHMVPQAEYMERWVRFYGALAREPNDPLRASELGQILDELKNRSGLLDNPHSVTHVQAQTLLLAGMAARLMGDAVAATGYLETALATVRRINDEQERADLSWVVRLALLETVRVHRDDHRFDLAQRALREFESYVEATAPEDFGLRLVLALAESSVRQEQARLARANGDRKAAEQFENMRYEPLMKLARERPAARDEVYASMYGLMEAQVQVTELHPFAGGALIAGLLNDAATLSGEISAARSGGEPTLSSPIEELEARRLAALDRAIEAAQYFYESPQGVPADLLPEMVYNLGVAQWQRGRRLEAARMFLAVGRDHPQFPQAQWAATAAVQVASELAEDPSLRSRPEIQTLYLEALRVLTGNFPRSDDARYWQFFLAQLLQELGRYEEAAVAFAQVDAGHEYYVQAAFLRVRSQAEALREYAVDSSADAADLARRVAAVVEGADALLGLADAARSNGFDDTLLRSFLAEGELLAAEALLHLGKESAPKSLARLEGFEQGYRGQPRLLGRVLRVRILAYEQLGRLDEAERTLPEYVRSDPDNAGATLQALFESLREEVSHLKARGQEESAKRKAASALLLARQIDQWASADPARVRPDQKRAMDLQLAQALLQAEQYDEAGRAFAEYLSVKGATEDVRAIYGHAECLYQLARYEQALSLFHQVDQALSAGDELWFKALLRDLQCRTRLKHPPEGIIQVIRQQKFLHDDLGSPELRREFEVLLRENEKRVRSRPE